MIEGTTALCMILLQMFNINERKIIIGYFKPINLLITKKGNQVQVHVTTHMTLVISTPNDLKNGLHIS